MAMGKARAGSLRGELLAWLLVPLAAVVLFNVWTTHSAAFATASLVTDRTLLAAARVIAEQVREIEGNVDVQIPPSALEMFASVDRDRVVYRITGPSGVLIAGSRDLAAPPERPSPLEPLYYDTQFAGEAVRAVAIAQPIVSRTQPGDAIVVIAETMRGRTRLVGELWLKALRDQVLLVVAAGLLALFGLHRGLAPLLRLRDQIVARDPVRLEGFPADEVQREVQPLVRALNQALANVGRYVASQRRFVANASHQLRTPLAILKTQIVVGLREQDAAAKDDALQATQRGVEAMTRLTNQLLTLARAEPGGDQLRKETLDLAPLARAALEQLAPLAIGRDIDLRFEPGAGPFPVHGHETLLRELIVNLVDNALRYTPRGGAVSVTLGRAGAEVVLRVEDSGPGIPEAERARVFERFYRLRRAEGEAEVAGTGLGLAIVREIIAAHGGTVSLSDRTPPPGLAVVVTLPPEIRPPEARPPEARTGEPRAEIRAPSGGERANQYGSS
jgi:two-component system sensor histidine kinase TctE